MEFIEESFDLPVTLQGGISLEVPMRPLHGSLELAFDGRDVKDEGSAALFGGKYTYRDLLSFGLGYQTGGDTRDVSVGLGVQQGRLAADWAYIPISDDLGDEHRFSLGVDL